MRRTLLDEGISIHVRQDGEEVEGEGRVNYFYSKDARRRGWMVEEEVFDGIAHCAHFWRVGRGMSELLSGCEG